MRIAIAQINTTVGDLAKNADRVREYRNRAQELGADLAVFPELTLTGYPPEDLLLKTGFIKDNLEALKDLAASSGTMPSIIGFVDAEGKKLYNAAAVIRDGKLRGTYHKIHLPNYGVFDEQRYFRPGTEPFTFTVNDVPVGITICEDIWYKEGPADLECRKGAKVIIVINASPYHAGKVKEREKIVQDQARANGVYIIYVNLVGGQDELVFDGFSMAVNPEGKVIARAEGFREDLLVVDLPVGNPAEKKPETPARKTVLPALEAEVYNALVLGLHDYVRKNGFSNVVIGLSGGIDSALVAAIAADALGKENVHGVFMPSRYSSEDSREDAYLLAKNLGIDIQTISIDELFGSYLTVMTPHFKGMPPDITEENLQARIRGNIMMALSNKFNWLVLTTGNKSEMSTGYATLYGDMAGGFALIKDVFKELVYALSKYRNTLGPGIPDRILTKAPTAELRPNQKDSDSLPPYEILDPILKGYVEEDKSARELIKQGFDEPTVYRIIRLVDRSEYKRRQSPPGVKITPKAFGRDRRMPITNRYTEKKT